MATSDTVARKYATALLRDLSAGDADAAASALTVLADVMKAVPALVRYAAHPQVERADKEALLKQVLSAAKAPIEVQRFAMLLLDQNELSEVPEIARSLRAALDAKQGVQAVDVVSAAPLPAAQAKQVAEELEARLALKVRPTFSVDPALLGGILVRAGSRELDGSVRGRLARMKEQLLGD